MNYKVVKMLKHVKPLYLASSFVILRFHIFDSMTQRQSNITSFLTSSPNTPRNEDDSIQPELVKKKAKVSRKKTSWIWEHFIEGLTDNNQPAIVCQVENDDGTKCNVKLKHDGSTGNGISHLWSVHKITSDGKQQV
jgi:hypothetical protein